MSSHFSPKSLLFYGTMIGSVTILFRVVSAYGEANLSAPPNVGGYYLSEQPLPGCPDSTQTAILIQQSGVYLRGTASVVESAESSESQALSTHDELMLGGLWQQDSFSLSGLLPLPAGCQLSEQTNENQGEPQISVVIQGTVSNADTDAALLTGTIVLNSDVASELTAIREVQAVESIAGH